jgi:lipopolysaccharide/colanic/teichoic acid biosynthesis glycosyltransferase
LLNTTTSAYAEIFRPSALGGNIKRMFDIIGALFLLIIAAPVLLFIIMLLTVSYPRQVIYRHTRIGYKGKAFDCYKFRTMIAHAETNLKTLLESDPAARDEWKRNRKLKNDPRVTRIGLFLRKSSLDELPQLINVLRGEMSLVGPRPIVIDELSNYGEAAGLYLSARPGITGPWQIGGRSDSSYEQRIMLDAGYIRNWSLASDLLILLISPIAVIRQRGSY